MLTRALSDDFGVVHIADHVLRLDAHVGPLLVGVKAAEGCPDLRLCPTRATLTPPTQRAWGWLRGEAVACKQRDEPSSSNVTLDKPVRRKPRGLEPLTPAGNCRLAECGHVQTSWRAPRHSHAAGHSTGPPAIAASDGRVVRS